MPSAGEIFIVSGVDGTIAVDELDVGMSSTTMVGLGVKAGTSSGEG